MSEKKPTALFQIGKNGVSENFLTHLKNAFRDRENVRVVLLKSAGHDKESAQKIAEDIVKNLGRNYTAKIIGFTIILKKWRKPRR